MPDKSGGADPQRGFRYQNLAAAYFLVTDEPEFLRKNPSLMRIEQDDGDFHFKIHYDDRIDHHFFEVKYKQKGEIKWNKFKKDVVPEFYRISETQISESEDTQAYFHLVTNGAAAGKIHNLVEASDKLRDTSYTWSTFTTEQERRHLNPIKDQLGRDSQIETADEIDSPDSIEDLLEVVWGLMLHTPTEYELKSEIDDFLRDIYPGDFSRIREDIVGYISENVDGVVHRDDLKEDLGISLSDRESKTGPASNRGREELRREVEDIREDKTNVGLNDSKIEKERETVQLYSERVKETTGSDETIVDAAWEAVDEDFEDLKKIEERKADVTNRIDERLDTITNQEDRTSTSDNQ